MTACRRSLDGSDCTDAKMAYACKMTRTNKKVSASPRGKDDGYTPVTAAAGVGQAFKFLEGRWKLVILFHLFGGKVLRFSELERSIPAVSHKMLIQQLRQMGKTELCGGSFTIRSRRKSSTA
jgi:DNA-binding HxlR family transcriptional regulator